MALVERSIKRRRRAESRFRWYGRLAVFLGIFFVVVLFANIIGKGYGSFRQSYIRLEVGYDPALVEPDGSASAQSLAQGDYQAVARAALRALFPEVEGRANLKQLDALLSDDAGYALQKRVTNDPGLVGKTESVWVLARDNTDMAMKGRITRAENEEGRPLSDRQLDWIEALKAKGLLELRFNSGFFTNGDSREPEQAGIRGAVAGSLFTLLITLLLSFPIGVAAAIYLEEFAKRSRWTDLIEVNINNLAAVPSIVFGLLGLAVFINIFGLPRSAPLVGGLVLTLMTLPTIIIASRAAIKAVPPSIREAALGIGASSMQVVTHHVLPLALPGMLTGTIIGMARALGETAPLLMIGMVAFVVNVPGGFTDPATALPVQVYLWADSPERAFVERTSGAIMVLLAFLLVMNGAAVFLRQRLERRW
ncbi:MAG: phosphate ABC transporter permease PstA [Proteobacteria bacterium]|nr:phosphate ABC transporter permease PstA [Pseudomonadota bacterium]